MATVEALRVAWSQVLDVDQEEIEDTSNFTELGGDSVTALKLAELAPSHGIALEAEVIFAEPTFGGMLAKTGLRKDRNSSHHLLAKADTDLVRTCAKACSLSVDQIEHVFRAEYYPRRFFLEHQETYSWVSQVVFELSSELDKSIACKAFETIHARNHAFRSRFVVVDEVVQHVLVDTPITWKHGVNLKDYKAKEWATKVLPGQPTIRYGLVEEAERTFIVWTALHAVQDFWTRKLLCDDLGAFFNEGEDEFSARPRRPTYKSYVDDIKQKDAEAGKAFWNKYLAGLDPQGFPALFRKVEKQVLSTIIVKHIPVKRPQSSTIRLSTVAHVAFGLVLGGLTHYRDVAYISIRGSRTSFPGAEAIIGPLLNNVAVRVHIDPTEKVTELLSKVQDDSISMMRYEPFALNAMEQLDLLSLLRFVFNWYPRGDNLLLREIGQEGSMKVVEDEAAPYPSSSMFAVYDNGESLKIKLGYEVRIFGDEFMERLVQGFADLMHQICNCDQTTQVQRLLDSVQGYDKGS